MPNTAHYALKKSDLWHTPKTYLSCVREALGGSIDLDPASSHIANRNVRANRIYTAKDDGLEQSWEADTIFLNPPFSLIRFFVPKMIDEFERGAFKRGIMLCNASTSEKWFQPLYQYPICFTNHRIRFQRPDGTFGDSNTKGQAFVLFDSEIGQFKASFKKIGNILIRA